MLAIMWADFINTLRQQLSNQIVTGGLALGIAGALIAMVHRIWPLVWGGLRRLLVVTAVIDSRNDIFSTLVKWLNSLPYARSTHLVSVTQESDGISPGSVPKLLYSPAPGLHVFRHKGRLMWMERDLSKENMQVIDTVKLNMLALNRRCFEDLIQEIMQASYGAIMGRTQLFMPDSWADEWRMHTTRPKRKLDSVVLPDGVLQRIVDDVRSFHDGKERYESIGIPWRRGYLLHGPPGTGKTSLVMALAGELDLGICTLSLMHRKLDDQNLASLLQQAPAKSIVLIEDIDAFFQAREKQDAKMDISFSGLLNALDGVAAQEGRVVVMTTNHQRLLDPALIRPGRIDVEFHLANAAKDELRRMILRFFPDAPLAKLGEVVSGYRDGSLSPAQIQQTLQLHNRADAALEALSAMD